MTTTLFSDLGGETWRIRRFPLEEDKRWSAFNPSIGYSLEQGYVVLFRSSNYFFDPKTGDTIATIGTRVKNRMFLANLDSNWQIIDSTLREIDFTECGIFLRGPEDGRLYWQDGAWHILSVMREPHISDDVPRIANYRLNGTKAVLLKLHTEGDLQPVEKNWMPFYKKPKDCDYVYSAVSVYKSGQGKIYKREKSELASEKIRGGSALWSLGDSNLAIIHEVDTREETKYSNRKFGMVTRTERKYFHRFAKYTEDGTLTHLSDRFKFSDADIEFAAGLVLSGEDVIVSYGYKDVASYLGKIKLDVVIKMLKEV
jgi:predicted GH43/DUF377 family glycosyl hydrolase